MHTARNIDKAITDKQWSSARVAVSSERKGRVSLTTQSIEAWRSGRRTPNAKNLAALAVALGVTVDSLVMK